MAGGLDMSLDDYIRENKMKSKSSTFSGVRPLVQVNFRGRRGRDFGPGPGPMRRCADRAPSRAMPYNNTPYLLIRERGTETFDLQPLGVVGGGKEDGSGTKLYISSLDRGVSNNDMKLLFSDVGVLKGHAVHYDRCGKSRGTAEVVFVHKVDAVAAVKRYNGVHLDGKPMKIELVVTPGGPLSSYSYPNNAKGNATNDFNQGILGGYPGNHFWRQERNGGRGSRGGKRGGAGGGGKEEGEIKKGKKVSAKELDADLDKYRLEAPFRNWEA